MIASPEPIARDKSFVTTLAVASKELLYVLKAVVKASTVGFNTVSPTSLRVTYVKLIASDLLPLKSRHTLVLLKFSNTVVSDVDIRCVYPEFG